MATIKKLDEMVGRTVKTVEKIRAEYGRTYETYLLLTFTDGDRCMIGVPGGGGIPYDPNPPLEHMKHAPNYFTPEDMAERARKDAEIARRRKAESDRAKRQELEKLKKELGEG